LMQHLMDQEQARNDPRLIEFLVMMWGLLPADNVKDFLCRRYVFRNSA
jgi:hypothetical protein